VSTSEIIAKMKEVSDLIRGLADAEITLGYTNGNLTKITIKTKRADGLDVTVQLDLFYDAEGNLIKIEKTVS